MKKFIVILAVLFIAFSAFILHRPQTGITGTIDPADGAKKVWAISGADSLSVVPVGGKFTIEAKPGNWNIFVEANAPYRNASVENIMVMEGHPTDAGVIRLGK